MVELTPDESRVLGVLIEKAHTTPQVYPLTLNSLVHGCSQKNNREPVMNIGEVRAAMALDGLRTKGLAVEVRRTAASTPRYRHMADKALGLSVKQLVILAELLLRGPQSVGELRLHAARMHPLETMEEVEDILRGLVERPEPLVRQVPAPPGGRALRFVQLICPNLHPVDAVAASARAAAPGGEAELDQRVSRLEAEVVSLREAVRRLADGLGEPDPLGGAS
jgi:hypothetical protein